MIRMRDRRSPVVAVIALCVLALAACGNGAPQRTDVRPEAYLRYPGADEVGRFWVAEESGRSVDGSDLSHPARMTIRFRLPEPVPNTTIWQWYEAQLRDKGWTNLPRSATNHATFEQRIGSRRHTFDVEAGAGVGAPSETFSVYYTIGGSR